MIYKFLTKLIYKNLIILKTRYMIVSWNLQNIRRNTIVIYSKCCPCGGDIKIDADYEGRYHLTCIQCSREISKAEAVNLLKKMQPKVA